MTKVGLLLSIVYLMSYGESVSGQWQLPPQLPPLRRPLPLSSLLPRVPSVEFVERLTKAQLAFIRHHQEIQRDDTTNYTPYACLPKYICIVEDTNGSKRTAVVNGLHPALRETASSPTSMNTPYQPGKGSGRNDLSLVLMDPETAYMNQQRLSGDEFLREQELAEHVAMEEQLRRQNDQRNLGHSSAESGEGDTGESDEESKEAQSPSRQVQRPEVPPPPPRNIVAHQNSSGGILKNKFKYIMPPFPSIMPTIFKRQEPHSESSNLNQQSLLRRMLGNHMFRGKRDIRSEGRKSPFITKLGPGIKSSDQCRILYNGCELNYDQIMQIADEGQVLIEGDDPTTTTKPPNRYHQRVKLRPEDDEAEQAAKDGGGKTPPPFAELLQSGVVKPSKNKKQGSYKVKNKKTTSGHDKNHADERVRVPSLPIVPMKFNWGKPLVYVNGRPETPEIFKRPAPTTPPPSSTPAPPTPIFVTKPVYNKANPNRTFTETNIVKINSTHALEIKTPKTKPYRPIPTKLIDKNGNPASFASVFTEIAGSSGGIHDFFDTIAKSVGGPKMKRHRVQKQYPHPPSGPKPKKPPPKNSKSQEEEGDNSDEEEEEEDAGHSLQQQNDESEEDEEDNDDEIADEDLAVAEVVKIKPNPTPKPKPKYKPNKNKKKQKVTTNTKTKETVAEDEEDDVADDEFVPPKSAGDDEEDVADEEPTPSKAVAETEDEEDEAQDDEEDDSEERRKRNKAADEVQLPHFLSEDIKNAIREGIRNGHKEEHGKPKEVEDEQLNDEGDKKGGTKRPPPVEGQGDGGGYYQHPQLQQRPQYSRPRPGGGLFSIFG